MRFDRQEAMRSGVGRTTHPEERGMAGGREGNTGAWPHSIGKKRADVGQASQPAQQRGPKREVPERVGLHPPTSWRRSGPRAGAFRVTLGDREAQSGALPAGSHEVDHETGASQARPHGRGPYNRSQLATDAVRFSTARPIAAPVFARFALAFGN